MKTELKFVGNTCPAHDMVWALEIEWSHASRILEILTSRGVDNVAIAGTRPTKDPAIIYTRLNVVNQAIFPMECCKYVHRMFYVPYSCTDMSWIFRNRHFHDLLQQQGCVFKVSASPKTLERAIVELLLSDGPDDPPSDMALSLDMIHPVHYTHVIQCIYSRDESIFRWGIVSRQAAESLCLTSDALSSVVARASSHFLSPPVCRAFYKMQEVLEIHFPTAGWILPTHKELVAVDVGASPGGWTQYLSPLCAAVVSIDPGQLHPSVLALPNVTHVPHLAESPVTRQALEALSQPVSLCVCDVNFEAPLAADMLVRCIWPYMAGRDEFVRRESGVDVVGAMRYIVLTIKLHRSPSPAAIERSYASARAAFTAAFQGCALDFQLLHLNSNSLNERTILCRINRHGVSGQTS